MTAVNATVDTSMGRPSKKEHAIVSHTVLSGVLVRGLVFRKKFGKGMPLSRLNDQIILIAISSTSAGCCMNPK